MIYVPCGDRRASVCPACAETYRADTYQLVRAGLAGGKGIPESVAIHPCVFATFTAPSFGPVHTRPTTGGKVARCRPRRKAICCPHGRPISCPQRHSDDDACLGQPMCPQCYDYDGAVVWNAHAPELWRRTIIAIRRRLDRLAKPHGCRVRLSYAKVAEFQGRGLIHFHAIIRLDGIDPAHPTAPSPRHPAFTRASWLTSSATPPASPGSPPSPTPPSPAGGTSPGAASWTPAWSGSPVRTGHRYGGSLVPGQVRHQIHRAIGAGPPGSPRHPRHLRQPAHPSGTADRRRLGSATTPTTTSGRCAAGRTCSASAATSPPKAAATPPPCAPSAPPAATGDAARPATNRTRKRPPSSSPT